MVAKFLAAPPPLLDDVKQAKVTRTGTSVALELTLSLTLDMKPSFEKALGRMFADEKTREARNTIGAISRGAAAAYEREIASPAGNVAMHQPCKSAVDVPAKVPAGTRYQPSPINGQDYGTGDSLSGWRCLKLSMAQPHRYQYAYRQGGTYEGPARGLPEPGPNGYEASAEGDLDGDGKTSLFTVIGIVDSQTQTLRRVGGVNSSDPHE